MLDLSCLLFLHLSFSFLLFVQEVCPLRTDDLYYNYSLLVTFFFFKKEENTKVWSGETYILSCNKVRNQDKILYDQFQVYLFEGHGLVSVCFIGEVKRNLFLILKFVMLMTWSIWFQETGTRNNGGNIIHGFFIHITFMCLLESQLSNCSIFFLQHVLQVCYVVGQII